MNYDNNKQHFVSVRLVIDTSNTFVVCLVQAINYNTSATSATASEIYIKMTSVIFKS